MTGQLGSADHSLLDRFVHALARIVYDERPEALSRPVTVAELYQDIAPYRRMRELAGIEMHADYEHALIRLLSGEGGFAQLDPETAADELGIEAESSDPDLSLYRKFAGCDVRLSFPRPEPSGTLARVVELPPLEQGRERPPRAAKTEAPKVEPPRPAPAKPEPPKPEPATEPSKPEPSLAETMRALQPEERAPKPAAAVPPRAPAPKPVHAPVEARCAYCGYGLPKDREVRFCPHCGVDQDSRQCGSCGVAIEPGWRFCVACGAAADS